MPAYPQVVPFNREAEEALIGAVLINPDTYHEVADFLRAEDFYLHRLRWVWQAFGRLHQAHTAIDLVTVCDELERGGYLSEVGGPAYLTGLLNCTPTSLHAEAYARIVEEAAVRRRMLQAAGDVAKLAYDTEGDLDEVLEQAGQRLQNAADRRAPRSARPLSAILEQLFEHSGESAGEQRQPRGIPTGFSELDRLLSGMQPTEVLIAAGRPGMGKTAFLLSISRHATQVRQKHVAFFSVEMSAELIGYRLLAQQSGIDTQRLRDGRLSAEEWRVFAHAKEQLAELPLLVDDTPEVTPQQIAVRCRRLQHEARLDLVVIDYLQLVRGGGRFENRTQEISHISRQLKVIARELDVPVLAAAQLSRAVEQRADKRPILSDLRESGSIEQDADVVIFLHRRENGQAALVEVSVAKHRNGPTGILRLPYQAEITRFDNPQP